VWYQEPRLTYDPELNALSPFCMDLYTLNKRQEFPNRMNLKESYTKEGWVHRNKGTRLISFSRGKACMWPCHNACWVCRSCWFMTTVSVLGSMKSKPVTMSESAQIPHLTCMPQTRIPH